MGSERNKEARNKADNGEAISTWQCILILLGVPLRRPMKLLRFAFYDSVGERNVYYYEDKDGVVYMADSARARFRVRSRNYEKLHGGKE